MLRGESDNDKDDRTQQDLCCVAWPESTFALCFCVPGSHQQIGPKDANLWPMNISSITYPFVENAECFEIVENELAGNEPWRPNCDLSKLLGLAAPTGKVS